MDKNLLLSLCFFGLIQLKAGDNFVDQKNHCRKAFDAVYAECIENQRNRFRRKITPAEAYEMQKMCKTIALSSFMKCMNKLRKSGVSAAKNTEREKSCAARSMEAGAECVLSSSGEIMNAIGNKANRPEAVQKLHNCLIRSLQKFFSCDRQE